MDHIADVLHEMVNRIFGHTGWQSEMAHKAIDNEFPKVEPAAEASTDASKEG